MIGLRNKFIVGEAEFRSKLGQLLTSVRSGRMGGAALEDFLARFATCPCSPDSVDEGLNALSNLQSKISFAKSIVSCGAAYVGTGSRLDDEIMKHLQAKTFILYFNEEGQRNSIHWQKNRQLFFQESMKNNQSENLKFLAVDCDIHPHLWPQLGQICIQVLQNGKVISQDLLFDQESNSNIPVAKCTLEMEQLVSKPNKRINLVIPCTGRHCNPTAEHAWKCPKCQEHIEYGFDSFFYCGCGRGPASMYEFKCPDQKHGPAFERHNDQYFQDLLGKLRPFKELNILILGETGVGKSTWINGK